MTKKHAPPPVVQAPPPEPPPTPEPEAAIIVVREVIVEEPQAITMSAVDEVLALQIELESKREGAIKSLLDAEKDIQRKLTQLGFKRPNEGTPEWVSGTGAGYAGGGTPQPAHRGTGPLAGNKKVLNRPPVKGADRFCEYCKMSGHDARLHRGQGNKKKKFSAAELDKLMR